MKAREAWRQNESEGKKLTIWDLPRDKNARHQTKHERQNKGDKMLLMCVEGARGPLLYQNWEAKPAGKNFFTSATSTFFLFFKFPQKQAKLLRYQMSVVEIKGQCSLLHVLSVKNPTASLEQKRKHGGGLYLSSLLCSMGLASEISKLLLKTDLLQ